MKGHHATLLLLGIFVLWMEPISARIMRISRGNLHNETEASEDEITLKSLAPSMEAFHAPARPGECPRQTLPGLPHPNQAYCMEGQPCPGDEKCCRIGNIVKCVLPLGVHRGYCPWAERAVASSKSCSSDTDCALDEKCCPIEGNQRCAKAMPANPGLCPKKPLPPVSFTCKNKCEDDRSCPEDQKCCFVDCGLECVPPESHHISGDQVELDRDEDAPLPDGGHGEKEGLCPARSPPGAIDPCFSKCLNDNQCPGKMKCCKIECGMACLEPVSEPPRPGACPRQTLPGLPRPIQAYCMEDKPCPRDEKCCRIGNIMKCILPVGVHPGYCPFVESGVAFSESCSWDTDCALDEKCCPIEGHSRCTKAVPANPGLCPKKLIPRIVVPCEDKCKDDWSCLEGQKCCFVNCGLKCVPPERHPSGDQVELDRSLAAEGDHKDVCFLPPKLGPCNGYFSRFFFNSTSEKCEKFIYGGCGGNANNFLTKEKCLQVCSGEEKEGLCPARSPPGAIDPCFSKCLNDNQCPGKMKCCKIECGMACLEPVSEKEGMCPVIAPSCLLSPFFTQCFRDSQCPGRMKCCHAACGKVCLEPVPEPPRPGECPNPTLPGLPRPIQSYCLEDKPCPGEEKCCRVGNIMKCILPFGVHRGYCPRNEADENAINSCSWDTDCALDKKCCLSDGSQRCIKPLPANPGLCPKKVLPPVLTPCKDKCRDDRSCPKGQKCCFIDCGLKCVSPESHHRGDHMELDLLGDAFSLEEDHGDVCLLPSDQGDCDARFPRFFFNSTSGKCEKFIYGGCGGNANNFVTKEKCLRVCTGEDVCLLPSDQGDCDAHIPRFFYNSASGECERFIYGGCGGNENNFLNKEECLQVCSGKEKEGVWRSIVLLGEPDDCFTRCSKKKSYPSWWKFCQIHCAVACVEPQPDHCLLPPNPGDCRDQYPRFFYNPAARRCQKFVYNGCGGNKNNFQTREDCLRVCAHVAPRKPGMCPSKPLHEIPRSGQAYCMDDSACPGDEKCCQIGNITKCVLPLEATHPGYCPSNGSATASSLRCFWDTDCASDEKCCPSQEHKRCTKAVPATPGSCPKKCLPWLFTRCANKCKDDRSCPDGYKCCFFECGLRCVPPQYPSAGQQMDLDQDQGLVVPEMDLGEREDTCPLASVLDEPDPCLHLFSLQTRCPRKWRYCQIDYGVPGLELQPDYCLLRPERGNCHREVTRFFYDSVTRKCKKFIYSGCGANENNFLTSTECLRVCEGAVTPKPGDCPRETFPEYQPLTYDYCFEDAACPGEEKCCRVGTIRKCFLLQGVHHGYCPEKKDVAVSSKSCSWDTNCAMDEKCCPSERRKRCTKAVPEKPGLCPMKCFARVFSRCKNECKDDRSCPEDKKCCFADCGLKCVPAVDRRGGHRTAVNGNCGAHLLMAAGECPKPQGVGICVEECTGDESCGPGKKCCSNGCGHVCTKVTGVRPSRAVGECPKPQGFGTCVEECAGDEFCGPGEKCCSNGCGHVCIKVFPEA